MFVWLNSRGDMLPPYSVGTVDDARRPEIRMQE